MAKRKQVIGTWSSPFEGSNTVPGELATGRSFELTTHDALLAERSSAPGANYLRQRRRELPVVWGRSFDNKELVTLVDVEGAAYERLPSLSTLTVSEKWSPQAVMFGFHVPPHARYRRAVFGIDHLDSWVPHRGVGIDFDESTHTVGASATEAVLAEAAVPLGRLKLIERATMSMRARKARVSMKALFEIDFATPVQWEAAWEEGCLLRDLIRLASPGECALRSFALIHNPDDYDDEIDLPIRCVVRGQPRIRRVRHEPEDMLFRFEDLHDSLEEVIARWREVRQKFALAWENLTAGDHGEGVQAADRLVQCANAVERIHAVTMKKPEEVDAAHARRIEDVVSSAPSEHREWLEERLTESRPPTNRFRLIEMYGALGKTGTQLAGGDVERFASECVSTRNYLMHHQRKRGSDVLTFEREQLAYGSSLYWVGMAHLQLLLGIPLEDIWERLATNRYWVRSVARVGSATQSRWVVD